MTYEHFIQWGKLTSGKLMLDIDTGVHYWFNAVTQSAYSRLIHPNNILSGCITMHNQSPHSLVATPMLTFVLSASSVLVMV